MRKKAATPEIGAAVIWLEPKAVYICWHKFEDGTKVQRDIYSAFLLLCHNDDFKTINQDICISKYETFKKAHDKCVSDIKASGHKVCNSGI